MQQMTGESDIGTMLIKTMMMMTCDKENDDDKHPTPQTSFPSFLAQACQ